MICKEAPFRNRVALERVRLGDAPQRPARQSSERPCTRAMAQIPQRRIGPKTSRVTPKHVHNSSSLLSFRHFPLDAPTKQMIFVDGHGCDGLLTVFAARCWPASGGVLCTTSDMQKPRDHTPQDKRSNSASRLEQPAPRAWRSYSRTQQKPFWAAPLQGFGRKVALPTRRACSLSTTLQDVPLARAAFPVGSRPVSLRAAINVDVYNSGCLQQFGWRRMRTWPRRRRSPDSTMRCLERMPADPGLGSLRAQRAITCFMRDLSAAIVVWKRRHERVPGQIFRWASSGTRWNPRKGTNSR